MTQKYLIDLAKHLLCVRPTGANGLAGRTEKVKAAGRMEGWLETVKACADFCAVSNPRFDRSRFMLACGVE